MSGAAPPAPTPLDLREQIARIDRALAESHKLQAETDKLFSESRELLAEERKFNRDPWFVLFGAGIGALAGALATQLPAILRGLGAIQ